MLQPRALEAGVGAENHASLGGALKPQRADERALGVARGRAALGDISNKKKVLEARGAGGHAGGARARKKLTFAPMPDIVVEESVEDAAEEQLSERELAELRAEMACSRRMDRSAFEATATAAKERANARRHKARILARRHEEIARSRTARALCDNGHNRNLENELPVQLVGLPSVDVDDDDECGGGTGTEYGAPAAATTAAAAIL